MTALGREPVIFDQRIESVSKVSGQRLSGVSVLRASVGHRVAVLLSETRRGGGPVQLDGRPGSLYIAQTTLQGGSSS